MRAVSVGALLYIVAVVLFVLAAFGVTLGSLGELDIVALGLAVFSAAHVVP